MLVLLYKIMKNTYRPTFCKICFSFWGTKSPRPPTRASPLDPTEGKIHMKNTYTFCKICFSFLPGLRPWTPPRDFVPRIPYFMPRDKLKVEGEHGTFLPPPPFYVESKKNLKIMPEVETLGGLLQGSL